METELADGEEIRPVIGYEGLYAVTSHGRVMVLSRKVVGCGNRKEWVKPASWVKPQPSGVGGRGYYQVGLTKDGRRKLFCVHKLVAEAFIPNDRGLPEVNHLDGDKKNCKSDNLVWCTRAENVEHARANGMYSCQSSKYRGVSWNKAKSRWVAFAMVGPRRSITLGAFRTEKEAADRYAAYASENGLPPQRMVP